MIRFAPPTRLFPLLALVALLACSASGQRGLRRQAEATGNLVENGDFSRGTRGWLDSKGFPAPIGRGSRVLLIDVRGGRERSACLRLDTRGQGGRAKVSCAAIDLPKGRRYRLECWARSLTGEPVMLGATIAWVFGRVPRGGSPVEEVLVRDGDWGRYGFDFTVPEGVTRAQVDFSLHPGVGVAIDDVSVTERVDQLEVRSFAPSSAVLRTGEEGQLVCTLVNAGGTVIPSVAGRIGLEGAERDVRVGDLLPGEVREVAADCSGLEAGVHAARLVFEGRLGAPVRDSTNVVVYDPEAPGGISIDSGDARLRFHRLPEGHGVVELLHREGEGWRTVGVTPGLGRLRLANDTIDRVLVGEVVEGKEGLVGRAEQGGMVFDFSWKRSGDGWFDVRVEASARRGVDLAALFFPEVHAGWGGAGGGKDSAVFGGLELLDADRYSSGTEASAPEVAGRYVPHPMEVTIPVMCVVEGGLAVGLAWDPLQRWDGRRTMPSTLFASPNRWMNQSDHLMALFLPAVPEFVDSGSDRATRPCSLFRGQKLTLEAELFVLPVEGNAGDVLVEWYGRHGAPPPAKPFTRWEDAARRNAAWMIAQWDERAAGWPHQVAQEPGFDRQVAKAIFLFGLHDQSPLGRRALAQAEASFHRVVTDGETGRLGLDLALHLGHVPEVLDHLHGSLSVLPRQREDGAFGFGASDGGDPDAPLAQPGDVALGTSADRLEMLLQYARVAGNPSAYRGTLKGLAFTETLAVPTGSQTWEIPILAPDLLSAQEGIDLQLRAYELTGKVRHLAEAKRWARCGLAFLSTWESPGRPGQLYASTAVFGSTRFAGSWWGKPVQWIGIAYAGALLRLAPHDPAFPWATIAEGLLASGIQQQALAQAPGIDALFPGWYADFYRLHDGALLAPVIAPWTILREMNEIAGHRASSMRRLGGGIGRGLTSAAEIEALDEDGDAVTARLRYPPGRTCHSVFGPMGRPSRVVVGRRELELVGDLETVREGWWFDAGKGLAVIKHRFATGPLELRIEGVSNRAPGRR